MESAGGAKGLSPEPAGQVTEEDLPLYDAVLALETVVENRLASAIKASETLHRYGKELKMDLLMERMKLVLSKKKKAAVKWRALVGIDGSAAPNDGTPHSLLKAVELAASAIADFAKAGSKDGKVIKGLMTKSKTHTNKAIIRALDPNHRKTLGAEGKLLRELLEESESDKGLWAAAERAVQDLRVQPSSPDKIKASLEAVVAFTKAKSEFGTAWEAYQVQLQDLLRNLDVLKVNFGKAFKPIMDLDEGLQPDSLVPTVSFLGLDPIPISSNPMVRTPPSMVKIRVLLLSLPSPYLPTPFHYICTPTYAFCFIPRAQKCTGTQHATHSLTYFSPLVSPTYAHFSANPSCFKTGHAQSVWHHPGEENRSGIQVAARVTGLLRGLFHQVRREGLEDGQLLQHEGQRPGSDARYFRCS